LANASVRGVDVYLHDATLTSIELVWEARTCAIRFSLAGTDFGRHVLLVWHGVTQFSMSAENTWGPSTSVNEARSLAGNVDEIEMQSGDIVRIQAEAVTLRELSASSPSRE
jgi:hypothetical protein